MKRIISLLLALALTAGALTGCQSGGSDQTTAAAVSQEETASAGSREQTASQAETEASGTEDLNETKELVLGSVRDMIPGEGDAFYVNLSAGVWEPLIYNNNHELQPGLAKSWSYNEDCTEWTFVLRDDAVFTDGVKFNADVCIQNIERYKAGPLTSTYTSLSIDKSFPNLSEIVKVDDYTVKFVFSEPITTLDALLGDYGSPMISPNCFDVETGEITSMVIGTGPYKVKEHVPDQYAVFERNDDYYGEPAKIRQYRVNCIPDSETRYSALISEEVMGLIDNGAIMIDTAVNLVNTDDRFVLEPTKSHMTHYMYVNGSKEYLSDVRLRQAISMALDRDLMNETLYAGLCQPAYSILSYQTPLYKDIQGEYNLEKAKELAKEVLGDTRLQTKMVLGQRVVDGYPVRSMAEYIQSVLSELGIDMEIEIQDNSLNTETLQAGDYDFGITVTGLNSADPYSFFQSWMASDGSYNTQYHWEYSNPEVDQLLADVLHESDPAKRQEIYNRLQDISAEDLPMIPLLYYTNVNIHNKAITGYTSDLYDGVSIPTIEWVQ
mgnify:CR=1 FL=1